MMTNRLEEERPGDNQLFIFDGCDVLHEKCNSLSVCAESLKQHLQLYHYDHNVVASGSWQKIRTIRILQCGNYPSGRYGDYYHI